MSTENYDKVVAVLPPTLPPLTSYEANKAVTRLYRRFGLRDDGVQLKPFAYWRRVWISRKPTNGSNHHKGWGRLIHDVSHDIFNGLYPNKRPHDRLHSHYEAKIAAFVATETDWLQGGLARKEKAKPTLGEKHEDKKAQLEARLAMWQGKVKRAENKVRKYKKLLKRLTRRAAKRASMPPVERKPRPKIPKLDDLAADAGCEVERSGGGAYDIWPLTGFEEGDPYEGDHRAWGIKEARERLHTYKTLRDRAAVRGEGT